VEILEGKVGAFGSTLVRPTHPISLGARATHHISDAELAGASNFETILGESLLDPLWQADAIVAHNATFDRRMIAQTIKSFTPDIPVTPDPLPDKTICTYRCALHLYPDADGYSNQVLRYYLKTSPVILPGLPPHRALADALVTASIVCRMLEQETAERLVELTTLPVLLSSAIRFGKHKGKKWEEVETSYLEWIIKENTFDVDVTHTARHWVEERRRKRASIR
jgi:exodeoxyribonuclease X